MSSLDNIRSEFSIFRNNPNLIYLDSAASTQKPIEVIDNINHYYSNINANIHRGVYQISQLATEAYEESRSLIANFLGAKTSEEIVFTKGTTEGINLIAQTFARSKTSKDDEIIISHLEHHSNIVPWQILCQQTAAKLKVIPIDNNGDIKIDEFKKLINKKTKIISIAHVSNALGTINPIKEIIEIAHKHEIPVIVDGAQAISHMKVDVKELDCDFYVISGHKMYAPTGIGALYGKLEHLKSMPPYQAGGDMILSVSLEDTIYQEPPYKFEAGTPHISGAIAFGKAINFLNRIGIENIYEHENKLIEKALEALKEIPDLTIIGNPKNRAGAISFTMKNAHPHDVGTILDQNNIAIRTGHHCAQPIMNFFQIPATSRISFGVYNNHKELDFLKEALLKVRKFFN